MYGRVCANDGRLAASSDFFLPAPARANGRKTFHRAIDVRSSPTACAAGAAVFADRHLYVAGGEYSPGLRTSQGHALRVRTR
jgi:hypothetical protein